MTFFTRAVEEFRGLILTTRVWFEGLAGFYFCYMYFKFCNFKNRKMLTIDVAHKPSGNATL